MLDKNEEWTSICELDDSGEIKFTQEFLALTTELGGETRKFASRLITHWTKEFDGMLDYFGPDDQEKDWYTGIDGEAMDVREDTPSMWEYYELPFEGLDTEWYRDVMRAKLVTIKLPKRLIAQYIKVYNKNKKRS